MKITEEFVAALAVDESVVVKRIAAALAVSPGQVSATVSLIKEGCTVPFISRYRKEMTGSLDEVQVREIGHRFASGVNLETRRLEIVRGIFAQGKLDETLYGNLSKCATVTELEDIYAPYRKKKKTRGMVAREKGLEPLAERIRTEDEAAVLAAAAGFVREDAEHPELSVASAEDAIQGAKDILAENLSQDPESRAAVKAQFLKSGSLLVKGVGDEEKKAKSVYQTYWDYKEPLSALKPHRILAVARGEREGELEIRLDVDEDAASAALQGRAGARNRFHGEAIDDGLRRLLAPAVLREIRMDAMMNADGHAIEVFSVNLRNLLMAPPIRGTRVLGVDPGIRTGTKCAALDETGRFLGYFVVNQERDPEGAKKAMAAAVKEHGIRLIAVGNGTASHEVRKVVAEAIAENGLEAQFTVVDEDGASVYSASGVAREEFPDLDLTIRGAISIGHRLQDPLAELVKIEPKSIGVGLYQHDVNQRKLSETLDEVVGSVVNRVGVNINTASASLLRYVSGVNAALAKKIVKHRDGAGVIRSREELRAVAGMGPKTFEQCAGFLKVPESDNPLDNTWVHPERYALAAEIRPCVESGAGIPAEKREELKARFGVGDATLNDVSQELARPGRDPREGFPPPVFQQGVVTFEDLREGMKVTGKVKNVVDFGAFVDIGIKESALVHISELSVRFVRDPMEVLKAGDVKEFRIISLDMDRRRIGLSLKPEGTAAPPAPRSGVADTAPEGGARRNRGGRDSEQPAKAPAIGGRREDGRQGPRQEPRQGPGPESRQEPRQGPRENQRQGREGDQRGPQREDRRGGGGRYHGNDRQGPGGVPRQGPGGIPRQGPREGPIPSAPVQKSDTVYNPFAELLKNRKK